MHARMPYTLKCACMPYTHTITSHHFHSDLQPTPAIGRHKGKHTHALVHTHAGAHGQTSTHLPPHPHTQARTRTHMHMHKSTHPSAPAIGLQVGGQHAFPDVKYIRAPCRGVRRGGAEGWRGTCI